jgi:hypothetical protein
MNEQAAGRLESAGARARALLGAGPPTGGTAAESAGGGAQAPGAADVALIAARLATDSALSADEANALAADLVDQAKAAAEKLVQSATVILTQRESLALESVMQVRGRPALRIIKSRLEGLAAYPGSELWQNFIVDYEQQMLGVAAATGAAMASAFATGNPPWVQGSAWLVADDRVVTNRHVLWSDQLKLVMSDGAAWRFRDGVSMAIEFAADDRDPRENIRKNVTEILYLSAPQDPVDIAVMRIEASGRTPLKIAGAAAQSRNLYVVGHPGQMIGVTEKVRAVFGNPDGRKRVSFGKRLETTIRAGEFIHDASTVGGYSGGPVLGMTDSQVIGLHYYGDPSDGNMAFTADTLLAHDAHRFFV